MRTLKFKVQLTNAFFATVNQMLCGSSQLPTTAERAVIKSLSTVQTTKQCSAVVVSWEEPQNVWLTAAKNAFVGWALNFRVCMLLKSAVSTVQKLDQKEMYFSLGNYIREPQTVQNLEHLKDLRWRRTDFSSFSCLRRSTSARLLLFWAEGQRVSIARWFSRPLFPK